ncbi:MAG TPA: hypothetical protein VFT41_03645 [Gemmatimonadaceae bacterium]|nr:hypothetical protein [Gemmatimonadaceae bacterium]
MTMALFGLVMALLARTAAYHERLHRRQHAAATGARASRQAVDIIAAAVQGASPADLVPDGSSVSVLDIMVPVATGIACADSDILVVPSSPAPGQPALMLWNTYVRAGDRAWVFGQADTAIGWESRTVVAVNVDAGACAAALPSGTLALRLDAPASGGPLVALRLSRRTRFNLYRSGTGDWYLGMAEWNAATGRFNGVQPVAGPLRPRSTVAARTGLQFSLLDSAGDEIAFPLNSSARPAAIAITSRSADSSASVTRLVALRGAR